MVQSACFYHFSFSFESISKMEGYEAHFAFRISVAILTFFTFSNISLLWISRLGKNWHCDVLASQFDRTWKIRVCGKITIFVNFGHIYFNIGQLCQNIIADRGAGASNPHPHPNPHSPTHKHTQKVSKTLVFPLFDSIITNGRMDQWTDGQSLL